MMRRSFVAGLALIATLLGGCDAAVLDDHTKVRLTISHYRDAEFSGLLRRYEQQHPDVAVVERDGDFRGYHSALARQLTNGDAADVVAIDENFLAEFRARPGDFANLVELGAAAPFELALPVNAGGLAMCYQRELFKAAGLPTDRAAVAKLWPTWPAYLRQGQVFRAAKLPANWTDSAVGIFDAVLSQQPQGFYTGSDAFAVAGNPALRQAWDIATEVVALGESAQLAQFTPQWTASVQSHRFATLVCPSWMIGWLQRHAPDIRRSWDATSAPGGGGGWGGAYLAIPKHGKHQREAYQLAAWLAGTEQQIRTFHDNGNLPAQTSLYHQPAIADWRNPFVNDAPVGRLLTDSALARPPQRVGPLTGRAQAVVEDSLKRVDGWELSPTEGWQTALDATAGWK